MQRPASLRSKGGRNGVDQVAGVTWTDRPKSVEYAVTKAWGGNRVQLARLSIAQLGLAPDEVAG